MSKENPLLKIKDNIELTVKTPFQGEVQITLINKDSISLDKIKYVKKEQVKILMFMNDIYFLEDGMILSEISSIHYVLFRSEDDYNRCKSSKYHSKIFILFEIDTREVNYAFIISSRGVEAMLANLSPDDYVELPEYSYEHKDYQDIVRRSKFYQFKDGSILSFAERAPNVYDGQWYPDMNSYRYHFENTYGK